MYWILEISFYSVIILLGIYILFSTRGKNTNLSLVPYRYSKYNRHNRKGTRRGRLYGKTEDMCRNILFEIFGKRFVTCRPDFLRNPATGKNLEIDCFNEELKLALEYDGRQHYRYTKHFHKSVKDFFYQISRDDFKTKKLKEEGIHLIRVPYYIKKENLEKFILTECQKVERLKPYLKK